MKAVFKSKSGNIYDNVDLALCDDAMHATSKCLPKRANHVLIL